MARPPERVTQFTLRPEQREQRQSEYVWSFAIAALDAQARISAFERPLHDQGLPREEIVPQVVALRLQEGQALVSSIATAMEEAEEKPDSPDRRARELWTMTGALLAWGNVKNPKLLPGFNVAVFEHPLYLNDHEFSNKRIRLTVPHPTDADKTISQTATLQELQPYLETAAEIELDTVIIMKDLVRRHKPEQLPETEDEFLLRRAGELSLVTQTKRGAERAGNRRRSSELFELENMLATQLFGIWVTRKEKQVGGRKRPYPVNIEIGYQQQNLARNEAELLIFRFTTNNQAFLVSAEPSLSGTHQELLTRMNRANIRFDFRGYPEEPES